MADQALSFGTSAISQSGAASSTTGPSMSGETFDLVANDEFLKKVSAKYNGKTVLDLDMESTEVTRAIEACNKACQKPSLKRLNTERLVAIVALYAGNLYKLSQNDWLEIATVACPPTAANSRQVR